MNIIDPGYINKQPLFPEREAIAVLEWLDQYAWMYRTNDLEDYAINHAKNVLRCLIPAFRYLRANAEAQLDQEPDNPENMM